MQSITLSSFNISTFTGAGQLQCTVNRLSFFETDAHTSSTNDPTEKEKASCFQVKTRFTWKCQEVTADGSWWLPISLPNYSLICLLSLLACSGTKQSPVPVKDIPASCGGSTPCPLPPSLGTQLISGSLCHSFKK